MNSALNTSSKLDIEKVLKKISQITQNQVFPQSVRHFLLFLGFPRSGNSFLGQLINAHPNALVANEGRIYELMEQFPDRDLLFRYLLTLDSGFKKRNYQKEEKLGNVKQGYVGQNFLFECGFQGFNDDIHLLGNSKAGGSTHYLHEHPGYLPRLQYLLKTPLKIILLVRHPTSMIKSHHKRTGASLASAFDYFENTSSQLDQIKNIANNETGYYFLCYEKFMADMEVETEKLMAYLGLKCGEMEQKIFQSNKKINSRIDATITIEAHLQEKIDRLIDSRDVFEVYRR